MSDLIFGHGHDIKKEYTMDSATSPPSFQPQQQMLNANPVISQAAVGLTNGNHNMMIESPVQPHNYEQPHVFAFNNQGSFVGSPQPIHSPSQPPEDELSDVLVSQLRYTGVQ